ncbi:mechanosensitive ion channel family protein [Nocardioides cavernaquae]|uniref:Mechanosensitive ion channel family protein n=1 Tax=Nocardioides cavernaquae TaxID=2321396 RepID=A0A3A5H2T8_9ACTN|nr:mechanosensitive ion channel family protein [Nocardioides cavernaquae]RJS45106.1 mechanosensitive ion channel family protein [Nocardioides cavernaquae]
MLFRTSDTFLPQLLPSPDACDPDQAISCRLVHRWTGNDDLAELATWVLGKPLAILVLILLGLLVRWVVQRVIDRTVDRLANGTNGDHVRRRVRARTMGSLLKSIVTTVIVFVVLVMVIAELDYPIAPLLASAGVVGLAIGFGAQSLVKDYISGVFMIFEDQYGVGDVVDLGEATGTIEAVGLRVTRLRDVNGTVWYVRNGEILRVGNMSQNWARTVLDIGVSYRADLDKVRRVLQEVAHELWEDPAFAGLIIEEPEVWGVEALAADAVTVRVTLKTAPMEQWKVAREMRERIKDRFDAEGIEIPFPQRVVWHRNDAAPSDGPPPNS